MGIDWPVQSPAGCAHALLSFQEGKLTFSTHGCTKREATFRLRPRSRGLWRQKEAVNPVPTIIWELSRTFLVENYWFEFWRKSMFSGPSATAWGRRIYNRMRYCSHLWTHSKNVPLSLTRRDGHEKPLLFFVPLTWFGGMVLCIIYAYGSKNVTEMGKTRLYYAHNRRFIVAWDPLGRGSSWWRRTCRQYRCSLRGLFSGYFSNVLSPHPLKGQATYFKY